MKKAAFFIILTLSFMLLPQAAAATNIGDMPDIQELENYIGPDVLSSLPDGVLSSEQTSISAAFSFSYFFTLIKNAFIPALSESALRLSHLLSMILIASLFHSMAGSLNKSELSHSFSSVSSLCVCVYVFSSILLLFESVHAYLKALTSFANAVTPFISIVYAAGGNITAGAVSTSGLLICITLIENVNTYLLFPLLRISSFLTIASSVSPKLKTGTLSGFVRGFLMLMVSLTVAAISAIMTFQQTLASSADTLASRAIRFATSSFIPIVGSAISEAVRTISGSIGYIRASTGAIGIAVILVITLPTFATLMISRINLAISASIADMLGCEREKNVLKEAGGLVNFLIALVSLMAVMFIYFLTLLIRCSSAYSL